MAREWFPHLLILVGVLLVANTLWAFPHAGERVYTYEAHQIEYTDDYLRAGGDLEQIDCYGLHHQESGCLLWTQVAQEGPTTIEYTDGEFFDPGTRYVVVEDDPDGWTFYERVVERSEGNVTLRLEPVTPGEILANVSVEYDELSDPGQEAIRSESVTVRSDSLRGEGEIVSYRDEYYVIRYTGNQPPRWSEGQARFLRAVLGLVGLGLALGGQRRRGA